MATSQDQQTADGLRAIALNSGSNGNCIYIEEPQGSAVLVDAGLNPSQVVKRLAEFGRDIRRVCGVFITHEHSDHVRYAGALEQTFSLPIYFTPTTQRAALRNLDLGPMRNVKHFRSGESVTVGAFQVDSLPTPHDCADGVGFVVRSGQTSLGVFTDLGHVFDGLRQVMGSLDAVLLESNYDPDMLSSGPYPSHIKHRIRGPGGHISNQESAELVRSYASPRLKWVCLAHLSEANNEPDLALRTHREIVGRRLRYFLASRYGATGILAV